MGPLSPRLRVNQPKSRYLADKSIHKPTMNDATKPSILRCIHLILSIPILGYIDSPFSEIPKYAFRVRFVFLPALVLSGLWMWKGHALRRLISKKSV